MLSAIHDEKVPPTRFAGRIELLLQVNAIERVAKHGRKFILAQPFYKMAGHKGEYTRKRGLDDNTNRALLLKHITDNGVDGSRLADLKQVLPLLSDGKIRWLLKKLREAKLVHVTGNTRAALWFPGPNSIENDEG